MEVLKDIASFVLFIIIFFGTLIACFFAVEHADVLATSEKPMSAHTKWTLRRFAKVTVFSGLVVTVSLVLRLIIRDQSIKEVLTSVGIYKIFIVPTFWLVSFLTPSNRKKKVNHRAKLRKQKLKAST